MNEIDRLRMGGYGIAPERALTREITFSHSRDLKTESDHIRPNCSDPAEIGPHSRKLSKGGQATRLDGAFTAPLAGRVLH
jgi:hypothetical protein